MTHATVLAAVQCKLMHSLMTKPVCSMDLDQER